MLRRLCLAALLVAAVTSANVPKWNTVDGEPPPVPWLAISLGVTIGVLILCIILSLLHIGLKLTIISMKRAERARFEMEGLSILDAAVFECAERNVTNGCKLGVGSGATGMYLVDYLSSKFKSGHLKDIVCVPSGYQAQGWILDAGLPISDLESTPELDIFIDGVDDIDEQFVCIKDDGMAKAKFIHNASKKFFIIADGSKQSAKLGEHYNHVPIEVHPFAARPLLRSIVLSEGGTAQLRMSTEKSPQGEIVPHQTESGTNIIDWVFDKTSEHDWPAIHRRLISMPVPGLFIGMVDKVYFAYPDGGTKEIVVPRDIV